MMKPAPRPFPAFPLALLGALLLATVARAGVPAAPAPAQDGWDWSVPAATRLSPVASALDKILASERARTFYRDGLASRERWAPLVDEALENAGMPASLRAIPLVESGYVNLGDSSDKSSSEKMLSRAPGIPGRGLWMFIAPTARSYGLVVEGAVDERLDPVKETAAAIALLGDLHETFGDWGLALAGYNQGQRLVKDAIAQEGTREVWTLIERGALNSYAAEVAAAAVILEDPGLVR